MFRVSAHWPTSPPGNPPADNGPRFPSRVTVVELGDGPPSYTTEVALHLRGKWCHADTNVAAQAIHTAVVEKWSNNVCRAVTNFAI